MAARKRGRPIDPRMTSTLIPNDLFDQVGIDYLINGSSNGPRWDYFNVWLVIRLRMGRTNGFYLEYNDLLVSRIAREGNFSPALVKEAVTMMLECDLFSKDVFEQKKILTSVTAQEDFLHYKKQNDGLSDFIREMARSGIWLLPIDPDDSARIEEQPSPAIGNDAPSDRDRLLKDYPDLPPDLIDRVISEAARTPGVRNELQYASGILKDCKRKGIKSIPEFEKDKQTHDAAKAAKQHNPALSYSQSDIPDDTFGPDFFVDLNKPDQE